MLRQHVLRMEGEGGDGGGNGGGPGAQWFDSIPDANLKAFVQQKGFKDQSALAESYFQLEKTFGVPKERLLKLPENISDAASMKEVYARLGHPEKPDGYRIKADEGQDDTFAKFARETFHKYGLGAHQGEGIMKEWVDFVKAQDENSSTSIKSKFEEESNGLKKEWGGAHDQNMNIAKSVAEKLGVSKEAVAKLEKEIGYSAVMKMFHQIGSKAMEPDFINSAGGQGFGGALTPGQAQAKISELKNDSVWMGRFVKGDSAAVSEWNKLHEQLISPTN